MPNRHHTFVRDEVLPSWWANAIQAVLSTLVENFRVQKASATTIRVPAGVGDDLAAIAIDGRWRWVEANVVRAHPGGGAATFDIFVTAADNVIVNAPLPNTDNTNYAFDLAIVAHNATPAVVPGVVDLSRKVGECDWDGAQITAVRQLVGSQVANDDPRLSDARTPTAHAATHRAGGSDPLAQAVLTASPVLDVGQVGQIRAGRSLSQNDFVSVAGGQAPAGLWNLSNIADSGAFNRALTNRGNSVVFGVGINGAASSAAVFAGSALQALYVTDLGAGDNLRLRVGTWGGWFRSAKRGTEQGIVSKFATTGNLRSAYLSASNANTAAFIFSFDGAAQNAVVGTTDICDDRWHHVVATYDGSLARLYVDGQLDAAPVPASGLLFSSSAPLNIGSYGGDGATAASSPCFGRIDCVFVTPQVLDDDQVRLIYAAKVPHTYPVLPTSANLRVTRARRGANLVAADFPAQPLRLNNMGSTLGDLGSNNVALNNTGAAVQVAGPDGKANIGGYAFDGATQNLNATDAGLPSGLAARSYGCWFKTSVLTGGTIMGWGTMSTAEARVSITTANQGRLAAVNASDQTSNVFVADGKWHHVVVVEDNAAADGVKRKMYVDGVLVGFSLVMNAITLIGAGGFRIGSQPNAAGFFNGQIARAFVYAGALAFEDVQAIYQKQGTAGTAFAGSPKNEGDHVEAIDGSNVYVIFDSLEPQHMVDLSVAA